jgi:hypothetical protein
LGFNYQQRRLENMTTKEAANRYAAQHVSQWGERGWAVYNPHGKPVDELPVIYGFNNGGRRGWMSAKLIAEDGTSLGGHCCTAECYMPHDLGVVDGSRPDRHEDFRKHYPDGYRMEFVGYDAVRGHEKLMAAIEIANAKDTQS